MASALPPLSQLAGSHVTLFESYWTKLDSNLSGRVDATSAAAFLKKSNLKDSILRKIWELSDPSGRGYLDKQGLFMALRLVAACQNGKEPAGASISPSDPAPNLGPPDSIATITKNKWTISNEERARYGKMFQNLHPVGGLLTGDKARPVMLLSKLPVETLGKIWNLVDTDHDGSLNADEFAIAMHLVTLCQAGEAIPSVLPASLLTKSTTALAGSTGSPLTPTPSPSAPLTRSISPKPASFTGSPLPTKKTSGSSDTQQPWVVSAEVKKKYESYFTGIDKDRDGLVSGEESRGLFMASNLQQNVLAHIWNLCDIMHNGKLNLEQFCLAMFLIAEKVRGKEPPNELTPSMIPPSLRGKVPTQFSGQGLTPSQVPPVTSSTLLPTPLPTSSSSTAIPTPLTSTLTPTPSTGASVSGPALGLASDFSAIRELDTVANEIDGIQKEKVALQEEIQEKKELIQQRREEISTLQKDVSAYAKQRSELEREKGEAQGKLNLLEGERGRVETEIAELKQKCKDEQEEIERLKAQLSQQETSKRTQEEELEKLRKQLSDLRVEESEYRRKVEASSSELDKLQKANQNVRNEINQVRHKVDGLKEEHQSLSHSLTLFPGPSTPSSTPSSSVININDVGQLSAEHHPPQLSEPDAISARATAGSSSPVSSISGFSTNSHLDDPGTEDTMSKEDKSQPPSRTISDPFASGPAPSSSDPFAAFTVPSGSGGGDLFGASIFSGKPSDVSAFDPFGTSNSDPFKQSGGGRKGDPFNSDPFASLTPSTPTTTDPFSEQDPFSSDPFASTTTANKDTGQTWSSHSPFGVDPFTSHSSAPSAAYDSTIVDSLPDPFSSASSSSTGAELFGGSAFVSKGGGSGGNPFAPAPSQRSTGPSLLSKPGPNATDAERLAWAKSEREAGRGQPRGEAKKS